MKAFVTILFSLAIISCGQQAKEGQNTKIEGPKVIEKKDAAGVKVDIAQLASKIDPVCEMDITSLVAENALADTASYKGKLYGFCGSGCKDEFVKNPAEFIKN